MKKVEIYSRTDCSLVKTYLKEAEGKWALYVKEQFEKHVSNNEVYEVVYNGELKSKFFTIIEN